MVKKAFSLLNVFIILCFTLTGCSKTDVSHSEEKKGKVLTQNESETIESDSIELNEETHIETANNSYRAIACWGDSMMEGIGISEASIYTDSGVHDISYYNTPDTLKFFTSMQVYNFGVAGEDSYDIALRAGGVSIYTDRDVYITDHSSAYVNFIDEYGDYVCIDDYSGYGHEDNTYPDTVYINNTLCLVERDSEGLSISICTDARENSVTEMYINAGSKVIPKAAYEHSKDILILEMGSNGGWNSDYDELIAQYRHIIDNSHCADYIIVGDTDDPGSSADGNQYIIDSDGNYAGLSPTLWEQALEEAFEDHFLNTRLYLLENALTDCGLTPTENDMINMQTGALPEQIRADYTHFNSYGYYSKGKAIYLKGIQLGYWN